METIIQMVSLATLGLVLFVLYLLMTKKDSEDHQKHFEKLGKDLAEQFSLSRRESADIDSKNREEIAKNIKSMSDSLDKRLNLVSEGIEKRLTAIQHDNSKQLEKMRETVDEKLQSTLEKRLSHSFKQVGDRLEQVHKGLGEMQNLATGVGDLKKVLMNVRTRGTLGETQLASLLEQVLSREQYDMNVVTKKIDGTPVEFALKLPEGDTGKFIYIPIDAKFPLAHYQALLEAQEKADVEAVRELSKNLEQQIKSEAQKIQGKYIDPPNTTDFGILYLPVEGLYAEVVQRPGLSEKIRQQHRVMIAGPNTIIAILGLVQMGYRALAIQHRTGDVWKLLGDVRNQFGLFGDLLDKTQTKLRQASDNIDKASSKSRFIQSKLNKVQLLAEQENKITKEDILLTGDRLDSNEN